MYYELTMENLSTEFSIIERDLTFQGQREVAQVKVDPDEFTALMEIMNTPLAKNTYCGSPQTKSSRYIRSGTKSGHEIQAEKKKSTRTDLTGTDIFKLSPSLNMCKVALYDAPTAIYLGVSLGPKWLTDKNDYWRIQSEDQKLHRLIRVTGKWYPTVIQRRLLFSSSVW